MDELSPADFFALGNAAAEHTASLRERLARAGVDDDDGDEAPES